MRYPTNFFAGSRVKNSKRFTCCGITPLTIDKKLRIGVGHDYSFKLYFLKY
jgi:hypothetical protein